MCRFRDWILHHSSWRSRHHLQNFLLRLRIQIHRHLWHWERRCYRWNWRKTWWQNFQKVSERPRLQLTSLPFAKQSGLFLLQTTWYASRWWWVFQCLSTVIALPRCECGGNWNDKRRCFDKNDMKNGAPSFRLNKSICDISFCARLNDWVVWWLIYLPISCITWWQLRGTSHNGRTTAACGMSNCCNFDMYDRIKHDRSYFGAANLACEMLAMKQHLEF